MTCDIIMKLPSPHSVTQGELGRASLAPKTPATPKPMAAKPPAVMCKPGVRGFQYCSDQTWQLPTSSTITVSGGEILFISAMMRRGSIGTSFEGSKGSQKLRQSRSEERRVGKESRS